MRDVGCSVRFVSIPFCEIEWGSIVLLWISIGWGWYEPILVDGLTYMSTWVELYRMAKKAIWLWTDSYIAL